tara:strand:- start:324 stop:2243 length:1920 start_codon:yes stop_codon:yes gene_type:complete
LKETSFIEQNKKKWNRFEQVYESQSQDPEELSDLYMDITDDLSYAQTFYRRRTVRVYLNQLAQKVFTGVHKQKGESFKKFISVWKVSLPLEIYRSRKNLLFALVAFIIYALIGAVTTHLDPNFASVVLGQGYVDVTNENIANLNPLAIYEDDDQLAMFINITTNNLKVAFLTFFVGFFFTLGTHMLMFYNGVMLGTFQYFFHTKGLLVTSFLGIWIHGSFEISAIVLAGGAGITAGNGLLFPKSYTRIQSLQLSTKRGLKIMLSLVPFIIAAGFLESFVTANYQILPDWSKWAIIIFSFALILFFYVFYPIYVARKYPELVYQEPVENFKPKTTFRFDKIRSVGDIIADSFRMYRLQFKKFTKIIFLIVFPLVIAAVWLQDINHYDLQQKQYWYDWSAQLELMIGYGYHNLQDVFMVVVWTFIFALMLTAVLWSVNTIGEEFSWKSFFAFVGKRLLGIWLANIFLMLLIMTLPSWGLMLAVSVMPFFMLNGAVAGLDDEKFGVRFKRGFKYSAQHYGKSLLVLLILIGLTVIMMQPIAFVFSIHDGWSNEPMVRDVLDMVADFTKRIAQIYTDDYMFWANVLRQLVYVLFMLFLLPLLFITMSFGYYSELEKTEANGLKNAFKKFGKRSRTKETSVDFE